MSGGSVAEWLACWIQAQEGPGSNWPRRCWVTVLGKLFTPVVGDAENARPENDGQRKLWVWKMQEWKMTDKNYGVWKMQDWNMTYKLLAN